MSALSYRNLSRGCCVSTICSVVQFSCAVSACCTSPAPYWNGTVQ